jgi:hypothetical protein
MSCPFPVGDPIAPDSLSPFRRPLVPADPDYNQPAYLKRRARHLRRQARRDRAAARQAAAAARTPAQQLARLDTGRYRAVDERKRLTRLLEAT